jgi:YggT family protein
MDILQLLVETIGSILVSACLLRVYASWADVGARNPLMQFAIALTDWLIKPLRSLMPGARGVDWPSLLAAVLIAAVMAALVVLGTGAPGMMMLGLALYWVVKWGLWALMALVILQAILSWVNPEAPIAPVIDQLTRPVLAPIRKVVPLIGNVDVSPVVLLIIIQLLLTVAPRLMLLGRV